MSADATVSPRHLPEETLADIVRYAAANDDEHRIYLKYIGTYEESRPPGWLEDANQIVNPGQRPFFSLRALSLVSKQFRRLAAPHLFSSVKPKLGSDDDRRRLGEHYGVYVKRLVFPKLNIRGLPTNENDYEDDGTSVIVTRQLINSVRLFDLESVWLRTQGFLDLYLPLIAELYSREHLRLWPRLRSLRISLANGLQTRTRAFIEHFATTLEELEIEYEEYNNGPFRPLFSIDFPRLRRLTLSYATRSLALAPGRHDSVQWPKIEHLTIRCKSNEAFPPPPDARDAREGAAQTLHGVVPFFEPFAANLKTLTLRSGRGLPLLASQDLVAFCREHRIRLSAPDSLFDAWGYQGHELARVFSVHSRYGSEEQVDLIEHVDVQEIRHEVSSFLGTIQRMVDVAATEDDTRKILDVMFKLSSFRTEIQKDRNPLWLGPERC
ncbi:hypothetical protein JCM10212_005210 [Sporobolomyces blumeae]